MKKVAVIGAGMMGNDVALDLACFGYEVILKDINQDVFTDAESGM